MKETRCLSRESWSDFQQVFHSTSGCEGCWCLKHRRDLPSSGLSGEEARVTMRDLMRKEAVHGVIAYMDHIPVGWLGFEPAHRLTGIYGSEKSPTEDSWVIHCIFVDPAARGKGIARLLLSGGIFQLRSRGAKTLISFAIPKEVKEDRCMSGYSSSFFERYGFRRVQDIDDITCKLILDLHT